ncbi:BREX-1 system adenine-specific DNA-methyltransferase PglX [Aeromonas caviae]|uniref:BREX-1 system adenine-specific DNA-methyltransferase PglX n=1 Tax=Aeromonas caviae TaxID=648 RepID=UPI002B46C36D|nr:BREX-1 system adenine-specific DNA-methyltransferase PglX [Aeromonas caviae]
MSQQDNKEMAKHFYRASAEDFGKIPGSPIAYWLSKEFKKVFFGEVTLKKAKISTATGLQTGDNNRFIRFWFEVSGSKINKKWFSLNDGGDVRKWYGNFLSCINWENQGESIRSHKSSVIRNEKFYFHEGLTWNRISSEFFAVRYLPEGFIFDQAGDALFVLDKDELQILIGFLNSSIGFSIVKVLCPTLNATAGNLDNFPYPSKAKCHSSLVNNLVDKLINLAKSDWQSYERSSEFSSPLLCTHSPCNQLSISYGMIRNYFIETTLEMQRLEQENNRLFIEAYGLQDELTPDVPLSEITLTCNPHYRYGGNLTDEEREARLQSDTIAELVSYAIGCMMGRYSLDREGLVYAHAGNVGFNDLVAEGAYQRFAADGDGILPLTSEHWFEDDIAARIEEFVRTVWGADTLEENLQFIADSLCLSAIKPPKKGGETSRETIRRYLSTQFFKDHLKTYKKRPIYWLFSSGKEKAFECLVYLHRYNEATLPRMRTEYVTPLLGQMAGRIERLRLQQTEASTSDAKRIGKEIDSLTKQLSELRAFDDQLKHHADMRITLDLDDGVKVNYGKFGTLLSDVKAITGDKGE